jgi:alkylation response protein AidB-like acyl-CoA dehydrogenase
MQLDFTADQEELRSSVRAVLEKECPIGFVRRLVEDGDDGAVAALEATFARLDWPALALPEDCGGLGLGFVETAVMAEEFGRVLAPGPLLATVTQFAPAIREAGTVDQHHAFLSPVAAGQRTGTLALAEDGRDWRPSSINTVIARAGDGWVLHGEKRHVVEAGRADDIAVAARLEGTRGDVGVTLAVVPRSTPGVRVEPIATLDATRETDVVRFDDVHVPDAAVLGSPGGGLEALQRVVEEATVAAAVEMVGACQSIFDIALDYAKVRHQFGVPIGSFQAVKHKLANLFVSLERARSTCYFAAATIADDDPRRTLAASMAKAAAGDCQRLVAQDGIQLLGGIGYTWEHDVHLYVKRAKAGEGLFGTAAAHRGRVADLIGL